MSSNEESTRVIMDELGKLNKVSGVSPEVAITMSMRDIPGVSIARMSSAGDISCELNGHDLHNNLLTVESPFQAASLSKPVFAYLVLRLHQLGKFDLDRPLAEIVPSDPLLASKTGIEKEAANSITARMVLSHTSGFHIGNEAKPLSFEPGTEYAYSGVGINLLQNAVESATQSNMASLAQTYIFEPLDLKSSSFEPTPYSGERVYASNSLKTTPSDYAKFIKAWLKDDTLREAFIPNISLTTDYWAKQLEVADNVLTHLAWGLGVGLELDDKGKAITAYHSGDMSEWRAFFAANLETKEICVFMVNSEHGLLLADPIFEDSNIHLQNASDHFFQKYGFNRTLESPANLQQPSFREDFSVPKVEALLDKRAAYGVEKAQETIEQHSPKQT